MTLPIPYYQDSAVTLYHGDCRDILPLLPKVDLVLTDPPYGVNGGVGGDSRDFKKAVYSGVFADTETYIVEVVVPIIGVLVKNTERVVVTPGIRNLHLYPRPADMGCFWTPASCTHGPWGMTVFQPILYYGKDPRAGLGALPSGRQVTERSEKNGHPCPKPYNAWKWLLDKASKPSDTILDPFAGSGTTLVAAKQLGRKAIGIEIEEKYCAIAVKRLRQEILL